MGDGLGVRVQERGGVAGLLEEAHGALLDLRQLARLDAALGAQGGGAAVVLGQQRHHLVGAVAGALLDEAPDLEVLAAAHRLGEHPVGHVADQHVLEGQLALARQARLRARARGCPSPGGPTAPSPRSRPSSSASGASEPSQNVRPTTAACCTSRRSNGLERVEARGQHRLHGVGQLGDRRRPPPRPGAAPSPRRTAGCRRSARPPAARARRRAVVAEQRRHQLARVVGRERVEEELGGVAPPAAPARAPLEQLVARQAEQHQRRAHPLREVLDRVEHAVVGPVDVLEGQHQRPPLGADASITERSAEKNASRIRSGSPASAGACSAGTSRPSERPICAAWRSGGSSRQHARRRSAQSLAQASSELSESTMSASRAHHLAERPVDDARAVGQAAAGRSVAPRARRSARARTRAAGATCPRRPRRSA